MAFRNPFEIRREKLLDQLLRMRANFEQQLRDSAIPVLEGGRPGQRIRLQHAGQLGGVFGGLRYDCSASTELRLRD